MSDDEGLFADARGGGFPTAAPSEFVEFGFEEDASKKLTGRRKKLQRKVKPGSFGEAGRPPRLPACLPAACCCCCCCCCLPLRAAACHLSAD